MGDRFDTSDDSWSEDSKQFLNDYSENLESQADLIEEKKSIEDEAELDKVLKNFNSNKNEYLVEYAKLNCSKCTNTTQVLKNNNEKIESIFKKKSISRRIQIVEERTAEINGLVPATVEDCKGGLRDDINKDKNVNIVSFGNCGFILDGNEIDQIISTSGCKNNKENIIEALGKGEGSCYCFMDLNEEWENMPIELVNEEVTRINAQYAGVERAIRMPSYMKFNKKEGINMMSMLFCNFGGGCITALESGQDQKSIEERIEERIEELLAQIDGKPCNNSDELMSLSTVEILARMLYQESKSSIGQSSVMFSVVNRLFFGGDYANNKSNCLYSILSYERQYTSLLHKTDYAYNSFTPPISDNDNEDEIESWENAKRLAAILVVATEDYGLSDNGTKSNERGENVIVKEDRENYDQITNFLKNQTDSKGVKIINEIGELRDFRTDKDTEGRVGSGGNEFFNQ